MLSRLLFLPSLTLNVLKCSDKRRWVDLIEPNLVLGAFPLKLYLPKIFNQFKVKRFLSILEPYEYNYLPIKELRSMGVKNHLWIRCKEYTALQNYSNLTKALDFIKDSIQNNECVYVHCKAGRGRSATIVCCHLIKTYQLNAEEAINMIKSKRNHILLCPQQLTFVKNFSEQTLKK